MENKEPIIIDVTPIKIPKSDMQKKKEELLDGVSAGFDLMEKGFEALGKLAKSVGLRR